MRKFFTFILIVFCIFPSFVFAKNEKKKAVYFYSENCPLCSKVDDYFGKNKIWEKFEIRKIEVSGPYNMDYLNEFFDAFGVSPEKRGWPVVFFDTEIIVGSQPIIDNFISKTSKTPCKEFPTPQKIRETLKNVEDSESASGEIRKISFLPLVGAAVIDGINPCSFGVMIVFLSLVLLIRRDKRSLILGLSFVLGVFVFYFLLGISLGKFSLGIIKFSKFFSLSASLILIFMGILKMRSLLIKIDKFNLLKVIKEENFWSKIKVNLKKIFHHSWVNFVAGFLTGYFLIPCSYRPYFISVQSVYEKMSWKFLGIVFLYDLIFILPLSFLMVIMLSGSKIKRIDEWESKHSRLISMIMGVVLLFVGIYLAQNWI